MRAVVLDVFNAQFGRLYIFPDLLLKLFFITRNSGMWINKKSVVLATGKKIPRKWIYTSKLYHYAGLVFYCCYYLGNILPIALSFIPRELSIERERIQIASRKNYQVNLGWII